MPITEAAAAITAAKISAAKGFIYSAGTALVIFFSKSTKSPWRLSLSAGIASTMSGMLLGGPASSFLLYIPAFDVDTAVQTGYVLTAACGPAIITGLYKLSQKLMDRLNIVILNKIEEKIKQWFKRSGK